MGARVVVAIGGNSIVPSNERATFADQAQAIAETCEHLAALRARPGVELALTHGNGPQVGFILARNELARSVVQEAPLDSIDADTQGSLGYQIQQALGNALRRRGLDDRVVAVVTQVVVDAQDGAFARPTKPIGRFYGDLEAQQRIAEYGWNMVQERKRGWRRVVPSPRPLRIVESWAMSRLLEAGAVVVGCGGGGIPVVETPTGLRGVQGVIDKDLASALLAREVGARTLVFSTGVPEVRLDFGGPLERPVRHLSLAEAQRYLDAGEFPEGSMGPKVSAAIEFLRGGGERAIVTAPECLSAALDGQAGTAFRR